MDQRKKKTTTQINASNRDVSDPHFYRIQDFTGSLIRIPDLAFD